MKEPTRRDFVQRIIATGSVLVSGGIAYGQFPDSNALPLFNDGPLKDQLTDVARQIAGGKTLGQIDQKILLQILREAGKTAQTTRFAFQKKDYEYPVVFVVDNDPIASDKGTIATYRNVKTTERGSTEALSKEKRAGAFYGGDRAMTSKERETLYQNAENRMREANQILEENYKAKQRQNSGQAR